MQFFGRGGKCIHFDPRVVLPHDQEAINQFKAELNIPIVEPELSDFIQAKEGEPLSEEDLKTLSKLDPCCMVTVDLRSGGVFMAP